MAITRVNLTAGALSGKPLLVQIYKTIHEIELMKLFFFLMNLNHFLMKGREKIKIRTEENLHKGNINKEKFAIWTFTFCHNLISPTSVITAPFNPIFFEIS